MKYIDIHCHLDFPDYDADREEILKEMREQEISAIMIGASLERSKKAVEIAQANENIWACVGIHPDELSEKKLGNDISSLGHKDKALETSFPSFFSSVTRNDIINELSKLIKNPKVVGVGECGLDYFENINSIGDFDKYKEAQKKLFKIQIELALKYDKPLMLHIRSSSKSNFDAYEDALKILTDYKNQFGEKLRGDVHFFAADTKIAERFLDIGFIFSFTGVITFTSDYNEVIRYLPMDAIMSETDAPFVAPIPFRGKRNSPTFVPYVVKKMAEIKGKTEDEINSAILKNVEKLFNIHI